jgi:hypothetical protein
MEQFVEAVKRYQERQLVCIGDVDISTPQTSVAVSSHGEIPLNLRLLAQLAHENNLDWAVRLNTSDGDSTFVARPFQEEAFDPDVRAVEIADSHIPRPEIKSVLRAMQVPLAPAAGFSIEVKDGERSAWISISCDRQVTMTREMFDAAVRHARTSDALLTRRCVLLEIPTDACRKRKQDEKQTLASPLPKRRRVETVSVS